MRNFFKKIKIPGPNSESEKRGLEADQLMSQWYRTGKQEDMRLLNKRGDWRSILIVFIVFVLISALGIVSIYWIIQGNAIPLQTDSAVINEPLLMKAEVPNQVNSGDIVTLVITYQNIGKARLTGLSLNVLYPDNFIFLESSPEQPQNSDQNYWKLPVLEPNNSRKIEIKGQILGYSEEIKKIEAKMFYKPTNFHSTFQEEADAEFAINKSVLNIILEAPDNLLPEQKVECRVSVKNTSENILDKVKIKLTLPEDLNVSETSAVVADRVWLIDKLQAGEERELKIIGNLKARAGELKEFRAEAGIEENGQFILQNQAVFVAGVVDPKVEIEVKPLSEAKFGKVLQAQAVINNFSILILEDGVLELKVSDRQDLLLWDSLLVLDDYKYEVIAESSIRFTGLKALEPADEMVINFSFGLIGVPYDQGAGEFFIEITPAFSAVSQDLTVPAEVEGDGVKLLITNY
ncbi:MAG: hypothetical protein ABH896_05015 [Candidatus Jacksonbacteria bacterium]